MNWYGKFYANFYGGFFGAIARALGVFRDAALSRRGFARSRPAESVQRPRSTASAVAREEAVQ